MSQAHPPTGAAKGTALWYRRLRDALGHSIKLRLLLVFLLLALAMAFTFISGAQRAFTVGWREAAPASPPSLFGDGYCRLACIA